MSLSSVSKFVEQADADTKKQEDAGAGQSGAVDSCWPRGPYEMHSLGERREHILFCAVLFRQEWAQERSL